MLNDKVWKGYTQFKTIDFNNIIYFILLIMITQVVHLDMRDTGNMSSDYISIVEMLAQILDRVQAIESKHIQNLPATLRDNPNRIIVLDILTSGI